MAFIILKFSRGLRKKKHLLEIDSGARPQERDKKGHDATH